ncbi:hypothetical protein AMJ83_02705 [candidate division WOR_3 bacterium SM23_42]|uniref:tetrahydrofolate synthase n=1 Tax=candidate division WOR_3 bacterium SM23_42 TaxID=1703779 RepID=A0A0S8FW60_UNCW3|nr:MAG: hypothetical protein AMJ83_02705 [candidate division WOR_3 bacterium SM23_42]
MNSDPQVFLHSLVDYEKTNGYDYDLDAYKCFLENLNAPHKKLTNVILIGGTKGKGSTAAIINACLISAGYKVGLYTSPHLKTLHERIKVNDKEITNRELNVYIGMIKPLIESGKGAHSFFEALTTIALMHFLRTQTDFAILEVGLGGRLDATNAANPLMSVITRIGYDHTNLLGTRLSQIAREKAGIIRKDGRLITIHQRPAVEKTIRAIVRKKGSSIIYADDQHDLDVVNQSLIGSSLIVAGTIGEFETFLPLAGAHQIENLMLVLAALSELRKLNFALRNHQIAEGIKKTKLHGRFEVVSEDPLVIFDCAHNEDSFQALEKNLDAFEIKDFSLIFGTNHDKDIGYCLKHIFPRARHVFLVRADNPRALHPHELFGQARKYQKNVSTNNSVVDAIRIATKNVNGEQAVIITGSFYLWQDEWQV